MRIVKRLQWLEPYLNKVGHLVNLNRISKINVYSPRLDATTYAQGYATLVQGAKPYITISIYYLVISKLNPLKRRKKPYAKIDILNTLAHELAHLEHWDHTPEHRKLENKISSIFMTLLSKTNYVSEEHEMKYDKPKL